MGDGKHRAEAFQIDVFSADVVVPRSLQRPDRRQRVGRIFAHDGQERRLRGLCASVDQVANDASSRTHDRAVRFAREIAHRRRVPVVATRGLRGLVHALLHNGPFAVGGDEEPVQVDLEAVGNRVVVYSGGQPARADQGFAVEAGTFSELSQFARRLPRGAPTAAADEYAQLVRPRVEPTFQRSDNGCRDAGRMPIHSHDRAERLEPEGIAQPAEKGRVAVVRQHALADRRPQRGHPRGQPLRHAPAMKRKIGDTRTLHRNIVTRPCNRAHRLERAAVAEPAYDTEMSDPEDFAAMFEASLQAKPLARGQTVEGTIVQIGSEVALVDVGGKSEAVVEVAELKNADGVLEVAVGDRITATVVSTAGGVTLSRRLARRAATDREIERAFDAGLPVEGTVSGVVKGGYEVRVGHSRAFCPHSQIDIHRTADPEAHVGQVYTFRIVEYREGGKNIVLSRRALLEAEQEARAAEVRQSIVPGAVIKGRVVAVREFGAFVDLGAGIQGLLHVSELGWSRVTDVSNVLSPGDEVTVKVLRVSPSAASTADKISLGLKQLTDDPWSTVPDKYVVGQTYPGRVTRVAEFGAFVELEPGVEALAHVSTFQPGGRRDDWRNLVPAGRTASFEVVSIDLEKKRIGVSLIPEGSSRELSEVDEDDTGRDQAPPSFGTLADKLRGALNPKSRG